MKRTLTFNNCYAVTETARGYKAVVTENDTNIKRRYYSLRIEFPDGWKTVFGRGSLDKVFTALDAN